ncbi:MAG: hypothetical protein GXO14_05505 [Thermococci archaeon]|nr:hypothetical protein [Thermococci archaeon]
MRKYSVILLLCAMILTAIGARYYWDPGNSGWSVALGAAGAIAFLASLAGMASRGRAAGT